jgi:hypothetical protein
MNKDKLAKIKNKIKEYAPAVLSLAAGAISIGLAVASVNAVVKTFNDDSVGTMYDPLPEVTGDEKKELLAREDTVIQKIEDDLYFLSIVQKPEDES